MTSVASVVTTDGFPDEGRVEIPSIAPVIVCMDDRIQAQVSYLKKDALHQHEKPYFLHYNPPSATIPRTNISNETQMIQIRDYRDLLTARSLEDCGFTLCKLRSKLPKDAFDEPEQVRKVWYAEVTALLRDFFPDAADIVVVEHMVRKRHPTFPIATGGGYQHTQPTTIVHIDFTNESAALTGQSVLGTDTSQYARLLTVNLWKPLNGPISDWPLALCDRRTVNHAEQAVPADVVSADSINENARVYYSKEHEWYYFSNVEDNEVIIFIQSDSNIQHGGGVPHTGFYNPQAGASAPPRESVETRAFLYYK